MKAIFRNLLFPVILSVFAAQMFAQDASGSNRKLKEISGFRMEIIEQIDIAADKFVALAEATPQEKYPWRPADGVRSINDVFTHIVQANYGLPGVIGVKAPDGIPASFRGVSKKSEVAKYLRDSFGFVRQAVENMSDADMEKQTKFFGKTRTYREVFMFMTIHFNQHLGQSIAYSRMNGIVPPWSK